MAKNWPSSNEAMVHTYSLVLLFSRPRSFRHNTQLRAMQFALSMRNLALDSTVVQSPARGSLFSLATGMLVFAAKSYNIPQIVAPVKVPLTSLVKDPLRDLSEDSTLTAVSSAMYAPKYATELDDTAALSSLTLISLFGDSSNEAVADRMVEASPTLAEVKSLKERLTEQFALEDNEHDGAPSLEGRRIGTGGRREINSWGIVLHQCAHALDRQELC